MKLSKTWVWRLLLGLLVVVESAHAGNLLPPASQWVVVNDGVMGGLSQSSYRGDADYAGVFSGAVSLENNGGFASVRAAFQLEGAPADSELVLKVIGDGKTYGLRFRTDRTRDGIAYTAAIRTVEGQMTEHRFVTSDFTPVWRGRVVSGAPPLSWQHVSQIGVMISNKQEGDFMLRLIGLAWAAALE